MEAGKKEDSVQDIKRQIQSYLNGCQDVERYKLLYSHEPPSKATDEALASIDWTTLPIIPKYVDINNINKDNETLILSLIPHVDMIHIAWYKIQFLIKQPDLLYEDLDYVRESVNSFFLVMESHIKKIEEISQLKKN